jgi:hypothetical protein
MKMFATVALGACMTVALAGAGFAQSSSSSASNMSASDKAMMTKCQGMSESAMKADKNCMAFMKKHPDMMKNGTTGSSTNSAPNPNANMGGSTNKSK